MTGEFFTDEQNLAELVSHMPEEEQKRFLNYGHNRIEPVFVDRIFVVYKATGLTASKQHKPPEILTTLRVKDFSVDSRNGAVVTIEDDTYKSELKIGHVPRKVFNYALYMSVPVRLQLKYDARNVHGRVWRSLSFALLVKTKNRADFYSLGNTYAETPNKLRKLYPEASNTKFTF
jgi:hypothetical protein